MDYSTFQCTLFIDMILENKKRQKPSLQETFAVYLYLSCAYALAGA